MMNRYEFQGAFVSLDNRDASLTGGVIAEKCIHILRGRTTFAESERRKCHSTLRAAQARLKEKTERCSFRIPHAYCSVVGSVDLIASDALINN